MKSLLTVCLSLIAVGCQYGSPAHHARHVDPVFIPIDEKAEADPRWPIGVVEPTWYDVVKPPWYGDSHANADESEWAGRAKFTIETRIITWGSPDDLAATLRSFRLEEVSDIEFTGLSDRKAVGIWNQQQAESILLTAPKLILHAGQDGSVAITSKGPDGATRGIVIFAQPRHKPPDAVFLRLSAQGNWPYSDVPRPAGYRPASWGAEAYQKMRLGRWYIELAESEDPSHALALMVRVVETAPSES